MEKRRVLELYKNLAPVYEQIYNEQWEKYWLVSSQVGQKVADAGCGVGISLEVLDSYVVCLDLSPDMLSRARERRGMWGELVQADFWMPPFRNEAFDTALFISAEDPSLFDQLAALWLQISRKAIFEFRGEWRTYQRN